GFGGPAGDYGPVDHGGGLDHDLFGLHGAGQPDVYDPDAGEAHDGEHAVVSVPGHTVEQRNDARLAFDGLQVVLDAGAQAGIAVELHGSVRSQFEFSAEVGEIRGVRAVADLPCEIRGAVVGVSDIHGSEVSRGELLCARS